MDPLSLSSAFATVVGLLANFKAERSSSELADFMSWLREEHHSQLAQTISQNKALSNEISAVLAINHDELIKRITTLNVLMAQVASKVEGFSGLSRVLSPSRALSDQAKSVLQQLVSSNTESLLEHEDNTGSVNYICIGGSQDRINCSEPRFIKEDVETLVTLGFLRVEYVGRGSKSFVLTRPGAQFVGNIGGA